jgi:hypothetical protein
MRKEKKTVLNLTSIRHKVCIVVIPQVQMYIGVHF